MQNNPTISTNKIIFFVVFICAAIMTSLFVYRANHKMSSEPLANESRVVFPVARDIKNFELVSSDGNKFTQAAFQNHWTLLFFGFTHCSSICPTTLGMLSRAYDKLHVTYPNLQVVFISLDPERDDVKTLSTYTQKFNAAFISATGKQQDVRKLQSQLGVYSAATEGSDQIQHTPSILLINPEGKWSGLLKQDMTPDQFAATFETTLKLIAQQNTHA